MFVWLFAGSCWFSSLLVWTILLSIFLFTGTIYSFYMPHPILVLGVKIVSSLMSMSGPLNTINIHFLDYPLKRWSVWWSCSYFYLWNLINLDTGLNKTGRQSFWTLHNLMFNILYCDHDLHQNVFHGLFKFSTMTLEISQGWQILFTNFFAKLIKCLKM